MTVDERWSVFEIECKYLLSYYTVLNILRLITLHSYTVYCSGLAVLYLGHSK